MSFSKARRKALLAHVAPIAAEARIARVLREVNRRALHAKLIEVYALAGKLAPTGKKLKRALDKLQKINL